ncbi:hypothetical protein ILUMI_18490 [Ignelater luminosus]|uniref:Fe2OG dioxygenase domain-containing protein n=1 Tax=Ignelater luminosus TaxID=2038154 RepID=A0A8K0G6U2_IGNLU|nr:hypothetical protein ILUMI_18490 [Ignelater luminosus]
MTGLNMKSAEKLQVVNYGVGGYYRTHHDFQPNTARKSANGSRIATVLIYMSNVEQGGATVFPLLNVTIWPKKGTAAVWYNLDSYGNNNNITLHAACPVLLGSKWAANKWFREAGQEFIKPCPLHKETRSQ